MTAKLTVSKSLVPLVLTVVMLGGLGVFAVAAGERSPSSQPPTTKPAEGEPEPLELQLAVCIDESPASLLLRARNVTDRPVEVPALRSRANHLVVGYYLPHLRDYRREGEYLEHDPEVEVLQPGQVRQWEVHTGFPSLFIRVGLYKVYWKLGEQTTPPIWLYRKKMPPKLEEIRRRRTKPSPGETAPSTPRGE